MLPLNLLNTAINQTILVELKNGATFNGLLANCDNFMNLVLKEVIETSPEGERFIKLPECYIRGNTIKFLKVPDTVLDMVKEDVAKGRANPSRNEGGKANSKRTRTLHQ